MSETTLTDLAAVVYSSGKVFDGLQTGRLRTEEFLRTGDISGVSSMHDLALLRDLKDAARTTIEHTGPIDGDLVQRLNAAMTRSASIAPGALRRDDERIGVDTVHGRHEPVAISVEELERVVETSTSGSSPERCAATLFLAIAKAQPFKDGNKRTGIFAANALLLRERTGTLLTVPFDEGDPGVSRDFNRALARAYIYDEDAPAIDALLTQGITAVPSRPLPRPETERVRELKEKIARRAAALSSCPSSPDEPQP